MISSCCKQSVSSSLMQGIRVRPSDFASQPPQKVDSIVKFYPVACSGSRRVVKTFSVLFYTLQTDW